MMWCPSPLLFSTFVCHLTCLPLCFSGNGITLEGAVPTEQDSQPKPAKRARTSFTAEQLQVRQTRCTNLRLILPNTQPSHNIWTLNPVFHGLCNKQIPATSDFMLICWFYADHAGSVCPGQQSRCPDATETSRHDRPQQESYTGQYTEIHTLVLLLNLLMLWYGCSCMYWNSMIVKCLCTLIILNIFSQFWVLSQFCLLRFLKTYFCNKSTYSIARI